MIFDHILLIGYGAPATPADVAPYLKGLGERNRIPAERLAEVRAHYEAIGGSSPYLRCVTDFSSRLQERLAVLGKNLPVFVGMRCWKPFLTDTMAAISSRGLKKGLAVILAPHRSFASFDVYVQAIETARKEVLAPDSEYRFLPPWHDHPLFVEAHADSIQSSLDSVPHAVTRSTPLFFSSHSIPTEMAEESQYERQILYSASLIAQKLNHFNWTVGYQSRSGSSDQRWLEPDVRAVIRKWSSMGERELLIVPLGFLCDNAEVLYDLDIEARREAETSGMAYLRSRTILDHPKFLQMMAELCMIQLSSS